MRRLWPILLFAGAASAQDWGEDDGDDFADLNAVAAAPIELSEPSHWQLSGFYRNEVGVWTERLDDNPLAKLRQSLDLELSYRRGDLRVLVAGHGEYDAAYIHKRAGYDDPTLDTYELRYLDGEQYLAYGVGDFEFTVGRQIVAWGEGDVFSPLDVVNPRDLREPGLADLDDLRLAVLATRVGWFLGQHRIELMGIHELYGGERAAPFSAFSPFRAIVTQDPMAAAVLAGRQVDYRVAQDPFALDQQMILGRWVYKGPGWDFGLYGASVLDYQGVVRLPPLQAFLTPGDLALTLDHRRYTLVGHSGATAVDDWLIKWEVAATIGKAYNVGDPDAAVPLIGVEAGTLVAPMIGLTYAGFDDTRVSFEATQGLFVDEPDDLLFPADAPQVALRYSRTALRERLSINVAATMLGWAADYGWLARGEASYEIQDGLAAGVGYITYHPGDEVGPFFGLDDVDRFFVKLRYDFDQESLTRDPSEKAARIDAILQALYPTQPIPLDHRDPYTLLVAVMLSAQTTDKKVNQVTPALFAAGPTPEAMAALPVETIQALIREVGLAPTKAKNLRALSEQLVVRHDGEVPCDWAALEALSGVGHKTASVVMAQAFDVPAFPVDTHIHRLAQRWGLTRGKNVGQTERDLKKLFPRDTWNRLHLQIIFFGREHCPARNHDLRACPICGWAATAKRIREEMG